MVNLERATSAAADPQRVTLRLPAPPQVFVSHSSADSAVVEWVAAQARAVGLYPYLAEREVHPGTLLADKVRDAIVDSSALLVVLTSRADESRYVQQEIGAAVQCGRRVLALVADDVDSRSLAMLSGVEYLPFDPENLAPVSAQLTIALRQIGDMASAATSVAVAASAPEQAAFAFRVEAQLNLTGGQLLVVGVLMVLFVGGGLYLATRNPSDIAAEGFGQPSP